jgi:hypothetical protein
MVFNFTFTNRIMKKLILILLLIPFFAQAQVNGTIQRTSATGVVRYFNSGAAGIDTLVNAGIGTNGFVPVYNSTLKKSVWTNPTGFGTNFWSRNVGTSTLSPAIPNDKLNMGTGSITGGVGSFTSSGSTGAATITQSSGSGVGLTITKGGNGEGLIVNKTSGSGNAVTVTGTAEATTTSGSAIIGNATTGVGGRFINNSATNGALVVTNSGAGSIAGFDNGAGAGVTITQSGGISGNNFSISSSGDYVGSTGSFTSSVTGGSFVKSGGTSSQFLKADGTVDSTAYGTGSVTSVAALTLGTTGTDLSSTVANGTTTPVITLNVPDASATARGVVTTGTQTIAGAKTLTGNSIFQNNDSGNPAVKFRNLNGSGITAQWLTSTNTVGGTIYNNGLISTTPQGDLYGSATNSFTSSQLANSLTDETGTGSAVFSESPTFSGTLAGVSAAFTSNFSAFTGAFNNGSFNNTTNATNDLLFTANSGTTDSYIGTGFGTLFLQNNNFFNGTTYSFPNAALPNSNLNLSGGEVVIQTGAAGIDPTNKLIVSNAGALRLNAYGAGTLTTDASGNVTATSDSTWKEQFKPFTRGLADLKTLKPVKYHWTKASGLDTLNEYTYFKAQDVQKAIPEAVFPAKESQPLGVQDRPIIATMINAINELQAKIEELESRIKLLENK